MSIIHRDDGRICLVDCGQEGCMCKTRENDWNPLKDEQDWVRQNFDLEEILEFQSKHKVEILMEADYQYACYIDYKEGLGCYCSSFTPLHALVAGIKTYKNKNE